MLLELVKRRLSWQHIINAMQHIIVPRDVHLHVVVLCEEWADLGLALPTHPAQNVLDCVETDFDVRAGLDVTKDLELVRACEVRDVVNGDVEQPEDFFLETKINEVCVGVITLRS